MLTFHQDVFDKVITDLIIAMFKYNKEFYYAFAKLTVPTYMYDIKKDIFSVYEPTIDSLHEPPSSVKMF